MDPSTKTAPCLQVLLQTSFVHFIDAPSLALIMPVLQRALSERSTETKKMAAQIIGNMYSLTDKKVKTVRSCYSADLRMWQILCKFKQHRFIPCLFLISGSCSISWISSTRIKTGSTGPCPRGRMTNFCLVWLFICLFGCLISVYLFQVRAVSSRALGALVRGMGEESFEDLLPWLMETLTSENSSVDRSGAAQGNLTIDC